MSVDAMRMNRIGNTGVWLSAVGFGTCQLQMVPEEQAVETLLRGFALGVNWVHADLATAGSRPSSRKRSSVPGAPT